MAIQRVQPLSSGQPSSLWEQAPTELTRKCVFMNIYGETNTGKTSLALSAPGPIALIHSAEKIEGIVQPYAKEKDIRIMNFGRVFSGKPDLIKTEANKVWEDFSKAWVDAFKWAKTIIIDTDTDLWELIRLAYFGDAKPQGGRLELNWGPVNAEWKSVMRRFKDPSNVDTNVILISQTEDEYKEGAKGFGSRTGRTIRKGQKSIPFMADVIVRTECQLDINTYTPRFKSVIEKAWWNASAIGFSGLEGDAITFPMVMTIVTQTSPDQWGG